MRKWGHVGKRRWEKISLHFQQNTQLVKTCGIVWSRILFNRSLQTTSPVRRTNHQLMVTRFRCNLVIRLEAPDSRSDRRIQRDRSPMFAAIRANGHPCGAAPEI